MCARAETRYLEAYLSALPSGLASYPQCQHKAAFYRVFRERVQLEGIAARLPEPLAQLVRQPPSPNDWVPEVYTNAIYLASCDLVLEEARFFRTMYEINQSLLSSPLYRIMFMVISPSILLSGSGARWAAFHRGSQLVTGKLGPRHGSVDLTYPRHLFPKLIMELYRWVFQAAFELVTPRVSVELLSSGETASRFHVRWR